MFSLLFMALLPQSLPSALQDFKYCSSLLHSLYHLQNIPYHDYFAVLSEILNVQQWKDPRPPNGQLTFGLRIFLWTHCHITTVLCSPLFSGLSYVSTSSSLHTSPEMCPNTLVLPLDEYLSLYLAFPLFV